MKRRSFILRSASALALATGASATCSLPTNADDDVAPANSNELCVTTYNLRYANENGAEAWSKRRDPVAQLLRDLRPDVVGTQEGVYRQLRDLQTDLPEYDWIGLGRDGGSRGEFMAVFFRKDRLEALAYDHFWLSDTPEVIASSTWGNTNKRMVTWIRFKDRRTQKEFYLWNTHLDHALQNAREKGAKLILERLAKQGTSLHQILIGDFNAYATENPVYHQLVTEGGLADTWTKASERINADVNTFNGFEPLKRQHKRIDWILVRGEVRVRETGIRIDEKDGRYPSDHFPVYARLTLLQ